MRPRPMSMQGEVIMTSYQELTAEGESGHLFTDCCRAKEVINLDLGSRTPPEPCSRAEEGGAAVGATGSNIFNV